MCQKSRKEMGKVFQVRQAHEGVKACHREVEIAELEIERKEEEAMIVNV